MRLIYSSFLQTVRALIEHCIRVKNDRVGLRDPSFVTHLIKSLLKTLLYLRKHGRTREADDVAVRINELIMDIRSRQLARVTDASNRELRNAVKANSEKISQLRPQHIFSDVDAVKMAILLRSLLTLFTISEML